MNRQQINIGDTVSAVWLTAAGKSKSVTGKVMRFKPSKTGLKVLIEYERTSMTRSNFNWAVHEVWRPEEQCRVVGRGGGTAVSAGREMAMALIGNERDRVAKEQA